jgi:hypothetical protein
MPFPATSARTSSSRSASTNWPSASQNGAGCGSPVSDPEGPARLCPKAERLYNQALGGTAGNAPITDAEVKVMANQLLWFSDPRLLKIVYKLMNRSGF